MTRRNYDFVSNITSEIGSGTGLPAVSELSDAVITTPANNDVLTYETATSKWKNKPVAQNLNDLADVDIDAAADGEALIKSGSTWIGGASGDASFKVSYLTGSTLTVKAGGIKKGDAEYRAYAGTNTEAGLLAANLTVTPTVSASASYYLYIDTSAAVAAGLLTSDIGRKYYGVTNAMFMSTTLTPSEVDTTRYIPIGVYTTSSGAIVSTKVGNVAPRSVDCWSNIKLYEDKIVARYTSNGGETFPTTTPSVMDFETAVISSPYVTTGTGWKFTAPRNGVYSIDVEVLTSSVTFVNTDVQYLHIYKNNVKYSSLDRHEFGINQTGDVYVTLRGNVNVSMVANDYIDIRIERIGTSCTVHTNAPEFNHISIHEITNYPTSAIATPTNTPFAILTANPTPVTTGCVSGYERVLVDSSIHDQMNCEAFYWDASDTNASWEKKTDAPMMVHNGFIAMLSSYIDALDWASGDMLKVIAGNGARLNAIPAGKMPGLTTGQAIGAGYVGEKITWTTPPSTFSLTNTEADWTNATITLTAGVWEIKATVSASCGLPSGAPSGAYTVSHLKLTDSSNNIIDNQHVQNGTQNIVASTSASGQTSMLTICTVVNISSSTVYKLRGYYVTNHTSGSGNLFNQSGLYSHFYAIRIA